MTVTSPAAPAGKNQLEIRFVDGAMFVGGSALLSEKVHGKHWITAAPAVWGRGSQDNQSYGILPNQLLLSPLALSQLLLGSRNVRTVGTDTMEGTKATHYRGTVTADDLYAARKAAPDEATRRQWITRLDQLMALQLSDGLTMDQWIGDDGATRQFRMRGKVFGTQPGIDDGPLDLTVTFLDTNRPVTVKAPPADDTAPLGTNQGGWGGPTRRYGIALGAGRGLHGRAHQVPLSCRRPGPRVRTCGRGSDSLPGMPSDADVSALAQPRAMSNTSITRPAAAGPMIS
ncbi:hypothetical protein PV318_06020 [Streptomyces sp. ME02-6991-2B]|nr:hypothetical protein [Streptomyces sp. ME02-6991-2B]